MLQTEIVTSVNENVIQDIVHITHNSFPAGWRHGDEKHYYADMLKSTRNISIFLKDNEKNVGYLLAIPQHEAILELKDEDNLMKPDPARYYIEVIAILPHYRKQRGFSKILETLGAELHRRNIREISLHARVSNNFSEIIKKKMTVTLVRRIDEWKYYNHSEPTDYIEAEFK